MLRKSQLALAAAGAALALMLSACGASDPGGASPEAGSGATAPLLRVGSLNEPTSWDAAQANEGHLMPFYQAVYDTLLKSAPDGTLEPMVATDWEVSDDLLSLTLTIRDDVVFTDGATLDAEGVKANLEHFQSANGPMAQNLSLVSSVDVIDPTTVVLNLSAPDPALPQKLAGAAGFLASPDALGSEDITLEPVGSGPYVLDTATTVTGSRIAYDRNSDYWGDALPYDRIEFSIMTDETARLNALKSGQVDAAVFQRQSVASEAEGAGFAHEPFDVNWEGILFYDRMGATIPELADVRVREALAISIDREVILDAVHGGAGTLTSQTFGPESLGYIEELDNAYEYDPARARDLLAEAGAENLTLTLPSSLVFDPAIYEAITQNWRDIGVTVERFEFGPGQAVPAMLRGEVPIAYMAILRQTDWAQVPHLLGPEATWNPLGSETPELNELFEKLQFAVGEEETTEAAQAVNRYIVEDFWFSPLYRLEMHFYYDGDTVLVENQAGNAVPYIYNYAPAS